jgi:hypothetical protein
MSSPFLLRFRRAIADDARVAAAGRSLWDVLTSAQRPEAAAGGDKAPTPTRFTKVNQETTDDD